MSEENKEDVLEEESLEDQEDNEIGQEETDLACEEEVRELKEKLLRLQADFQNYKRRAEESRSSAFDYGVEKFTLDLLPAIDNFERALESSDSKDDSFYKGVYLIYEELLKILDKNQVTEIVSLYEEFDPNLHHAVFMEESDEHDENVVLEVLQKGYRLKEKIIRPSMVKVSK